MGTNTDGWSNAVQGLGRSFYYLVIFLIVVYIAYIFTKWMASSSKAGRRSGTNMRIVDSFSVGYQNVLQIISVGDRYYLIAVSKDRVTYLTEIDKESIEVNSEPGAVTIPFEKYLSKFKDKIAHKEKSDD